MANNGQWPMFTAMAPFAWLNMFIAQEHWIELYRERWYESTDEELIATQQVHELKHRLDRVEEYVLTIERENAELRAQLAALRDDDQNPQ